MRTNLPIDQDYSEIAIQESPVIEYTDEQVLATLADTEGWKKLKDWANAKKEFYQKYYPGGDGINQHTTADQLAIAWKSAVEINSVIDELLGQVETAKDNVKARRQ